MPTDTEIVLENGTLGITEYAFEGCTGLTSVNIPNSVTSIGDNAFEGCKNIAYLELNCPKIQNRFSDCKASLKEVKIGMGVELIETNTFKDFTALQRCSFASIESLMDITFENASANPLSITKALNVNGKIVTELAIPNSVTAIKNFVLYNCNSVRKVTGGRNVTSIGESAFCNNTKIRSVQIGDKVEAVSDYAFSDCSLTEIYNYARQPQNVGQNAFTMDKTKCTLYVLPESVDAYASHQDWYEFDIQPINNALDIEGVGSGTTGEPVYYDLQGRRVEQPGRKGIFIVNGKKIIKK